MHTAAFLKNLLDFIAKTGETAIFPYEGTTYVVLPADSYLSRVTPGESGVPLTDEDVVDRINREIARWKASESAETLAIDSNSDRATLDGTIVGEDNTNVNQ